jgi:hypothetical protein
MRKSILILSALLFMLGVGVPGVARAEEPAKAPAAGPDCPYKKQGKDGGAICPHAGKGQAAGAEAGKVACPHGKAGPDGKMKCPHAMKGEMQGDCPCKHAGAMKDCAKDCPHKAKGDCPCAKDGGVPADCPCHGKGKHAKGKVRGKGKPAPEAGK